MRVPGCLAVCVLVASGCREPIPEPSAAQRIRSECGPVSSGDYFLPQERLSINEEPEASLRVLLSRMLASAEEPSLSCGAEQSFEVYRLMWLDVFPAAQPFVIRVTRDREGWSLRAFQFRSWSDLTITVQNRRMLSPAEEEAITESVRESRFWTTPNYEASQRAFDGSEWIHEGRRDTAYHLVRRRGTLAEPLRQLALILVKTGGSPVGEYLGDEFLRDVANLSTLDN